jgi:hypothetical protein
MRARDLATPYPSVAPDTPAEEAARLLAEEAVEGVFVQDDQGELQGLVADTTLLAFLLPRYLAEDRALVGVLGEDVADALWQRLRGRTVRDLLPVSTAGLPEVDATTPWSRWPPPSSAAAPPWSRSGTATVGCWAGSPPPNSSAGCWAAHERDPGGGRLPRSLCPDC